MCLGFSLTASLILRPALQTVLRKTLCLRLAAESNSLFTSSTLKMFGSFLTLGRGGNLKSVSSHFKIFV